MRLRALSISLLLLWLTPVLLFANERDNEGCHESPVLTRIASCYIHHCDYKDYDAADLILLPSSSGESVLKHLEGRVEKDTYACENVSALQVRRNAEQALRGNGYHIDLSAYVGYDHYLTAHKGAQWVSIQSNSSYTGYDLTTVLVQQMKQEMTSNADVWADQINKTGHVSVYGIEFDTAKATIKPQSEKVLSEVLKLLNNQPGWKMKIEGHTDSTGTKAGNQVLSQQRAAAVVAWLVNNGIPRARLIASGLGDSKPIADNNTEEGRARNRRVELVKQ
jgi:OOP family OmpA-OmpF porin